MLLTIFIKIPHSVTVVMVVLMVLLLALKLVQSVNHTCGGGYDIVCTPPSPFALGGIIIIHVANEINWYAKKY